MNIDKAKFMTHWWEDESGNIIHDDTLREPNEVSEVFDKDSYIGPLFYHSIFPCQLTEGVYSVNYHPKTFMQKLLYKLPLTRKYVKSKIGKTFRDVAEFNCTYGSGGDCIVAMVNSGDYTLSEAIYTYASACEACMNVLCYTYLDGKDGYPEYSEDWFRANTICEFCKYDPLYALLPYNSEGHPISQLCENSETLPKKYFKVTGYGVNPDTREVYVDIDNGNYTTITMGYKDVIQFTNTCTE